MIEANTLLHRRPGLDPGPRFLASEGEEKEAGPRVKPGATSAFFGWPSKLTVGGLVQHLRQRAAGLPLRLPARHANVVQSLPLGPGSRLLVVEFGGRKLLVGQSRAGLSLLGEAQ
ncbi:MAG: hypothetical protein B7Y82_08020 [Sphingomonadales bacterium 32-65-25]|nr:MAG: hypothetical protein B7Y82_08020 [Sphingomonadales bacterium 32-65-25]